MTDFKQTTTYETIDGVYFYYTMAKTPDFGYNPKKIPVRIFLKQDIAIK
jgi:hypothetical protein